MAPMTAVPPPAPPRPVRHGRELARLLRRLGVPLSRVRLSPWPGTATVDDLEWANARGPLCELVDGTLVEKAMGWDESRAAMLLGYRLLDWVLPRQLGSVTGADGGYRFFPTLSRLPDVAFVSYQRLGGPPAAPGPAVPVVAPELAVEVLSRKNTRAEIERKLGEYFAAGTLLAWVVNIRRRTVTVRTPNAPPVVLREGDTLDGGAVLPGFTLSLTTYFAELFPQAAPPTPPQP